MDLPEGEYAIFGSAPMAIRGLRDSNDLDLIVKQDLWSILNEKFPESFRLIQSSNWYWDYEVLQIGGIEILHTWWPLTDKIWQIIDTADIINWFPYARLEYVLEWKKSMWRDKDKKDVDLILEYMNKNSI